MPISVVIPVYNEEDTIEACLARVLAQGDAIAEVVVVDNGSTDATAEIVDAIGERFDRVRRIAEPTPGVLAARSTGFDAARAPIMAKIDADTLVEPGWADAIESFFDEHAHEYSAATGPTTQYDMPFQRYTALVQRLLMGVEATGPDFKPFSNVFGANFALTRNAWSAVRANEPRARDIFEDVSLSLSLAEAGRTIALVPGMKAAISGRRLRSTARSYWRYTRGLPRTYRAHGLDRRALTSWVSVSLARATWVAFYVPVRMFDPQTGRWSPRLFFSQGQDRVDPHR